MTGPILGLNVASALDEQGRLLDPAFTFSPDTPQLAILVQVGKTDPAPLTITWYRVVPEGDQKLFEHTLNVIAYDRAFSIGANPGALAPGWYKAVAVIAGQSQAIEWIVVPPEGASTTPVADEASQGQPPAAGDSGTVPRPSPASGASEHYPWGAQAPEPFDECYGILERIFDLNDPGIDHTASTVDVLLRTDCPDPGDAESFEASVDVSVNGAPWEPRTYTGLVEEQFGIDPCAHGGSDLPGTKVHIAVSYAQYGYPLDITLGEDDLPPSVSVDWGPKLGKKVKAGDEIKIKVTAAEKRAWGPWQTGVDLIEIKSMPQDALVDFQSYSEYKGRACDAKSWKQTFETTYIVPEDAPAEFQLCAYAEDFASKRSSTCGTFYTGEVWEGTIRNVGIATERCYQFFEGPVRLVVARDGVVTGTGRIQVEQETLRTDPNVCPGPTTMTFDIHVSGTKDSSGFHLVLAVAGGESVAINVPVLGKRGEGTVQPGPVASVTVTLECKTCE
ncbi:MAG: hypothetical protein ACRD88_21720 [Terriglobia bacterium]